jgi:hypothetical protein
MEWIVKEGTRSFAALIDRLVRAKAVEIAGDVEAAEVVEVVWEYLESGALRFVRQDGFLGLEPCGDVAERLSARAANMRLMRVRRARMPAGQAFED